MKSFGFGCLDYDLIFILINLIFIYYGGIILNYSKYIQLEYK